MDIPWDWYPEVSTKAKKWCCLNRALGLDQMTIMTKKSVLIKKTPLALFACFVVFYFFSNMLQVLPNVIRPEIVVAFNLNGEQFGQLVAICLYTYSLMQLPAGMVIDRFGLKYWVALGCLVFSAGSFCFANAESLWVANTGRILLGLGGALSFVACMKVISVYFSATTASFLTGLTTAIGFSGCVFGLSLSGYLLSFMGWRDFVLYLSFITLVLAFVLLFFTRHEVKFLSVSAVGVPDEGIGFFDDLVFLFKQKETWLAAFYAGLMFVPTQVFGASWGVSFLCETYSFTRNSGGMYSSLIYVGWIIGAPFWGFVAGHFNQYYSAMMLCTILTFLFCVALIYKEPLPYNSVGIVLFTIGFFSSAYILVFAVMIRVMSPRLSGTILGIISGVTGISALSIPLVGGILDFLSQDLRDPSLSEDGYQIALTVVPVALLFALPLLWRLAVLTKRKRTFCS